ncbi:MAG: hypothetical protein ACD_2C00104G0004 [uncultured bacterium (gcode 4)]|uniref:Cadherin domain-containing protein n=1 Tax=uncultured bacterium (gcode 4) TaxID=1234023 RepID=K2FEW4_9BACT|nr:MAG: hypothetical protein ACD_2C00104G0004 [uncultured bacterium (gcode 4)]
MPIENWSASPEEFVRKIKLTDEQVQRLELAENQALEKKGIFSELLSGYTEHFRWIALWILATWAVTAAYPSQVSASESQFSKKQIISSTSNLKLKSSNKFLGIILKNVKKNKIDASKLSKTSIDDCLLKCWIQPSDTVKHSLYNAFWWKEAHWTYNKRNAIHNSFTIKCLIRYINDDLKNTKKQTVGEILKEFQNSVIAANWISNTEARTDKDKEIAAPVVAEVKEPAIEPVKEMPVADVILNAPLKASEITVPPTAIYDPIIIPEQRIASINAETNWNNPETGMNMWADWSLSMETPVSDWTLHTSFKAWNLGTPVTVWQESTASTSGNASLMPGLSAEYSWKTFKTGLWFEAMNYQNKNFGILKLYASKLFQIADQSSWVYLEFKDSVTWEKYQKIMWWFITTIWSRSLLNLSAADLKKFEKISLDWADKSFTWHKFSVWGEYSFLSDDFIRELWASVVYSQTDNKDFWLLKTYAEDNWSTTKQMERYGYFQWSRVVEAWVTWSFKLWASAKLKTAFWVHKQDFNSLWKDVMWENVVTKDNSITTWYWDLTLTQRIDWNRWNIDLNVHHIPNTSTKYRAETWYYIAPWVKATWMVEKMHTMMRWMKDSVTAMLWLTVEFWWKTKDYWNANPTVWERMNLWLWDLKPVDWVASDVLNWRAWTNDVSTFEVDNWGLSSTRKNLDWSIDAIIQWNWKLKTDVTWIIWNPSWAEKYFYVEKTWNIVFYGKKAAEYNAKFWTTPVMIWFAQNDNNVFILDQNITKWSVYLKANKSLWDLPAGLSNAIVTRKLEQKMSDDLFSKALQIDAANDMFQNNWLFSDWILKWKYLDGTLSASVINAVKNNVFSSEQIAAMKNWTISWQQAQNIAINNVPVPVNADISVNEDWSFAWKLSAIDSDKDALTYSLLTAPLHWTATITPDWNYTYTPNKLFSWNDTFTYAITDWKATVTSIAKITIKHINHVPTISVEIQDISTWGWVAMTPVTLPEATDLDKDKVTYTALWLENTWWLLFDANTRTISWTPTNFWTYEITYQAADGQWEPAIKKFKITVLDTVAPATPAFIWFINNSIYWSDVIPNAAPVDWVTYSATLDGSPYVLWTPITTDWTHTLSIIATKTINGKTSVNTWNFTIDKSSPSAPSLTWFTNNTTYWGDVTPNATPVAWVVYSATLDWAQYNLGSPVTADWQHTLTVTATKTLNWKTTVSTWTFSIDKASPSAPSLIWFTNNTTYWGDVTPDATPVAWVVYSATLDWSPYALWTPVTTDWAHTLTITATKTLNWKTSVSTWTFSIDKAAPNAPALSWAVNRWTYGWDIAISANPVAWVVFSATMDWAPYALWTPVTTDWNHQAVVTATKTLNWKTSVTTIDFSIDKAAPASPSLTWFTNNTIYWWDVTPDATSVAWVVYSATLDWAPFNLGSPVTTDWAHTLTVTATKTLNWKTSVSTWTFSIDKASPSAPSLIWFTNNTTYWGDVTPDATPVAWVVYSATLDWSPYALWTPVTTDWAHTLTVTATKTLNWKTSVNTWTFTIDKIGPTINSFDLSWNPWAQSWYTNTPDINVSVSGSDISGIVAWLINESSSTPSAASVSNPQPSTFTLSSWDGTKTVYAWAKDSHGNVSLAKSSSIVLDTVVPSALAWNWAAPSTQWTTYASLALTLSKNVQSSLIWQSWTTSKWWSYTITWVSWNQITMTYSAPTWLSWVPTQRKDTITISNIRDFAGNSSNLSVTTNPLN